LRRPEHENGKEVESRDEGDDERQTENPRVLVQAPWEHGELGNPAFPVNEDADEEESQNEVNEDVRGYPGVLTTSPLQAHREKHESCSAEKTTDPVDLLQNFLLRQTMAVDARRWVVENNDHHEG